MTGPLLVTGATGNVGRAVVNELLARGAEVMAAGSSKQRVVERFGDAVTPVALDFQDRRTWDDVARLRPAHAFLMRPPAIANARETLNPFVDRLRTEGLDHVVFLSVVGAESSRFIPHRAVEDHLRKQGSRHTLLRPGFFAQNLETAYRADIVEDDRIYVPAGRRQPVNWIDTRDIGEVAARVLLSPEEHRSQHYTLTGSGAVPWSDVVGALTLNLDREIRYVPASVPGYVLHSWRRQLPAGAIAVQTILHFMLRFGHGATEDPTLERLLGRTARTIHDYVRDHRSVWEKSA